MRRAPSSVKSPAAIRFPLASYPGLNPFALDLVRGTGSASHFLGRDPIASITPPGRARERSELVRELTDTNRSWGNEVSAALGLWQRGQSVTLVAGQQVGFGGGPLYTFAKIASLFALQRQFERQGVAATIFFWMATEDHDFDEVATLTLQESGVKSQGSGRGTTRRLRTRERSRERRIVGSLPVPDDLREALASAFALSSAEWLEPGITFRDSFALLLAKAFGGRIVLVDSLLPSLRRLGRDFFRSIVESIGEATHAIQQRSADLTAAGYEPQIVPLDGEPYPFLFHLDERNVRNPIHETSGGWSVGTKESTPAEVLALVTGSPESISTGSVSRPLLQDLVFGTDLFVGGPAEVAYYAQLGGLYERFGIGRPRVALRGHALFAPSRMLRAVDRYDLPTEKIFTSAEVLVGQIDPEPLVRLDRHAREAEQSLAREIGRLEQLVLPADRSLERSIARSRRHLQYHLGKLIERGRQAMVRHDADRFTALTRLHQQLAPNGEPQDRSVAWLPLWLEHGNEIVERTIDEILPDSESGVVVGA